MSDDLPSRIMAVFVSRDDELDEPGAGWLWQNIPDQPGKLILCETCRGIGYAYKNGHIDWDSPCEDCKTDGVVDRTSSNP